MSIGGSESESETIRPKQIENWHVLFIRNEAHICTIPFSVDRLYYVQSNE